jgi:hypothetical protein
MLFTQDVYPMVLARLAWRMTKILGFAMNVGRLGGRQRPGRNAEKPGSAAPTVAIKKRRPGLVCPVLTKIATIFFISCALVRTLAMQWLK